MFVLENKEKKKSSSDPPHNIVKVNSSLAAHQPMNVKKNNRHAQMIQQHG